MKWLPFIVLSLLLAGAVWQDVRSRRIPNVLVLVGLVLAFALQAVLPEGDGLFLAPFGSIGLLWSLAGVATGLALLLPMYALRALGAGDVKLLAMIGAFVGPGAVIGIAACTLLAGGMLALVVSLYLGTLKRMLGNSMHLVTHSVFGALNGQSAAIEAPAAPSGKLPYAIAIAAGAAPYLVYAALNGASLFA
ncbi:prepilin peptidase CpaA [Duganella sp. 3397]|uniref:Type IV leader peptidase family protein n=1 Tax=Duganella phyllosphaerae TaxID=762836 RepID=A0A1E7X6W0_9BURK|nr:MULTISPECIES: prepilin peptidase [Duganella]MDR7052193.1 prepilin peptidase CpaA [Duganella sp. 3397]OFA08864.1 type IV leader peptidase family protein [Duganella phyllosphaerae]